MPSVNFVRKAREGIRIAAANEIFLDLRALPCYIQEMEGAINFDSNVVCSRLDIKSFLDGLAGFEEKDGLKGYQFSIVHKYNFARP